MKQSVRRSVNEGDSSPTMGPAPYTKSRLRQRLAALATKNAQPTEKHWLTRREAVELAIAKTG
jgi:hypothetical protein